MRPTISGPDLRYQAPTYNIRPRPTISGPYTKQRFRSCSKRFSPRTASKIHEHFDQQNGTKLFLPQLCFIPFTICQVSSKMSRGWNVTYDIKPPISGPPYQAPHIRPPYQAPHIRPPISSPPYQTPHIKPPTISSPPYRFRPSI